MIKINWKSSRLTILFLRCTGLATKRGECVPNCSRVEISSFLWIDCWFLPYQILLEEVGYVIKEMYAIYTFLRNISFLVHFYTVFVFNLYATHDIIRFNRYLRKLILVQIFRYLTSFQNINSQFKLLYFKKMSDIVVVFVISRLRIFMQIHIFMNRTKNMERKRKKFISLTKCYNKYFTPNLFYIFCVFLHLYISHKCITIRNLILKLKYILSSRQTESEVDKEVGNRWREE